MAHSNIFRYLQQLFPTSWDLTRPFRSPSTIAGPYYITWFPGGPPLGEGWDSESFDSDGVLLIGGVYKPADIAQYALSQHEALCEGFVQAKPMFLAQARYLQRAQRDDGSYPYTQPNPEYSAASGWISAMAQGEAASVLMRAWVLTQDQDLKNAAEKALVPLRKDVARGGASFIRGSSVFFEEVATPNPCHILNGHLFAAFAIWEAVQIGLADEELKNLHAVSISTLGRWLDLYDAGGWSYYDLATDLEGQRHLASLFYHQFHISQLEVYGAMTGVLQFTRKAMLWRRAVGQLSARVRVWQYGLRVVANALTRKLLGRKRAAWEPMQLS